MEKRFWNYCCGLVDFERWLLSWGLNGLTDFAKQCRIGNEGRQGLKQVARKGGGAWPAWRGGDLGSPRKPAGAAPGNRGLPLKARLPHKKNLLKSVYSSTSIQSC